MALPEASCNMGFTFRNEERCTAHIVLTCETTPVHSLATLNAYATEGGLDVPFRPATCFNPAISLGRIAGPGEALGLWHRYESLIDAAAHHAVTHLRLDLSWARIAPRPDVIDEAALARYRNVVSYATSLGIVVSASASDGAWPSWLGHEPWIWPWTIAPTLDHLERVSTALPEVEHVSLFPIEWDITTGFLDGSMPPWRHNARRDAARSREQLAHITTTGLERGTLRIGADAPRRALVAGTGPLASERPLLRPDQDSWAPCAD